MDGLQKILKICSRNGFFQAQITHNCFDSILYGPLGSSLRRNIKREWLSSIINNTDTCLFPLEVSLRHQSKQMQMLSNRALSFLLPDVLENYFKILPTFGSNVPCGFATYGSHISQEQSAKCVDELLSSSILRRLDSRHWLCVAFFCPPKKSSDWFNYWSRYRYRWWRKFSSLPSKFSMSDVVECATGDQEMSLMIEFEQGKEKLETIALYQGRSFNIWCDSFGIQSDIGMNNRFPPSVIVCQTELDLAAITYLTNSFAEKWRNGEIRNLFQLHVKLAPYKVSVLLHDDGSDLKQLKNIASHLEKDFKKYQVPIFPCSSALVQNASPFSRLDEMGVPYTIVLDSRALQSGVARLRNRDSTLEEQVHITELTPKLLKYLQIKSHEIDGS